MKTAIQTNPENHPDFKIDENGHLVEEYESESESEELINSIPDEKPVMTEHLNGNAARL